jgi:2-methylcitrate dehydratase PrpD
MNETKELARFLVEIKYSDLPPEVIDKARVLILDQLGCELAFAGLPWNRHVYQYVLGRKGGKKESTLTYYGLKTGVEDAAFANATFGHGFEMDDTEMNSITHPGSIVIPAALALGEMKKVNGKEFLLAVVAGYEAMLRAGTAARTMIFRAFHGTGVNGPFGSAAAAGKILGFDKDLMVNAMGIAGSDASGVGEYTISGGSVKRLHAGFASQAGVRAALLAQFGMTGPATVLEGKSGFCQAYANEYFVEEITAGLGKEFRILRTGNKPYCCCAAQHATIDATAAIRKKYSLKPEDVAEVIVRLVARDVKSNGNIVEPQDITSAQFSGRFGVALRLIKGSNGFQDYSEKNIRDPQLLGMAKKVRFVVDSDLEKLAVGSAPAIVMIRLKDGTLLEQRVDYARGTIQNPMTHEELEEKFRGLASSVLPEKRVEKIVGMLKQLDQLDDISRLVRLLKTDPVDIKR